MRTLDALAENLGLIPSDYMVGHIIANSLWFGVLYFLPLMISVRRAGRMKQSPEQTEFGRNPVRLGIHARDKMAGVRRASLRILVLQLF